ncbi:MAG: hypothetical protein OEW06_13440 [Gemmatimonadota bacterium]|nr:hypothetical protein [Gemmatimonadota bacterium]
MAERKALLIRIDPRVHAAIERWARDDLRSVNAQIEFVLREGLRRAGRHDGSDGNDGNDGNQR